MRPNPLFASDDPDWSAAGARASLGDAGDATGAGLAASHYPVLLDEEVRGLTLLTHLGRPDEEVLEIDCGEVLVIVQGHHGYISPSWYSPEERLVPTWNFTVAHLHGTPQRLDEEENLDVLTRLVEHFERHVPEPAYLERDTRPRSPRVP